MSKTAFIYDDVHIPPENQIGEHSHPQWELSMIIYGAGTRTVGALTEPFEEGEIILIPPNIPHGWAFSSSHTDPEGYIANISVFFETPTLEGLSALIPELGDSVSKLLSLSHAVKIEGDVRRKISELLLSLRGMTAPARVAGMIALIQLIAEADFSVSAGNDHRLNRMERRLERIRIFCSCNFSREIKLDDVAAHVGMSKSSFCTFMRRNAGMSLTEFVNDIRLNKALEMLRHTDKTIADIAYDTGFANVTYFNRLFRNKYGCTPKSVRTNS